MDTQSKKPKHIPTTPEFSHDQSEIYKCKVENGEYENGLLGGKSVKSLKNLESMKDSKTKKNLEYKDGFYEKNKKHTDFISEVLIHTSQPAKIGILSSGGLSNDILIKLQKEYKDFFEKLNFHTDFNNLNNIISPIVLHDFDNENYIDIEDIKLVYSPDFSKSSRNKKSSNNSNDSKSTKQTNIHHYLEKEHDNSDSTQKHEDLSLYDGTIKNGYITSQPEIPDSAGTPKTSSIVSTDPLTENSVEESNDLKDRNSSTPTKLKSDHPTFKERALRVFHELKLKLGLGKKLDHDIDSVDLWDIGTKEIPGSEFDMYRNGKSIDEKSFITQTYTDQGQIVPISKLSIDIQHKIRLELGELMKSKNILFLLTYLDDEIDIENTYSILEQAKEMQKFTIVISCLPRYFGKVENVHMMNRTLQRLRLDAEIVLLLPYFNHIDFKLIPDLIRELMELIIEPGLINVDVADLKIVVKGGKVGVITFGIGRQTNRAKDAFFSAIDSKLLNVELGGVDKALLNVTGGSDMTLGEVEAIADQIKNRIKPGARLILGAKINPEMQNRLKIFILLGVSPMQVMVNRYANE
jgi:hypothetical protein